MLLVSGATATIRDHTDDPNMGHLLTPGNGNTDSVWSTGLPVAGDNECFNKLNKPAFVAMLKAMRARGVLWVACPDVVGDARATLLRFRLWEPVLRYYDLPVAFVAQDGQEDLPVPWDRIRCLFIGGSTDWKMGNFAARLICEAKDRGKWVHVGRVNTQCRELPFSALDVDSTDGSAYSRFSKTYIPGALARRAYKQHGWKDMLCGY
jgi:hypothetical protein